MFFDHYPYTNFHNVNLDWVLQAVKSWGAMVEANNQGFIDLKAANASFKEYVTHYLQNLDVSDEINDKLDQMLAEGVLTPYMLPYIQSDVSAWLTQHITPTTPAVDRSLTISGAAADAAVTGNKFKQIKTNLRQDNSFDLIKNYSTFTNSSAQGITWTWEGNICTVSGSSTGNTYNSLFANMEEFSPGETYYLSYESPVKSVRLRLYYKNGSDLISYEDYNSSQFITIPENCTGLDARLQIYSGVTINTTIKVELLTAFTNNQLAAMIDKVRSNIINPDDFTGSDSEKINQAISEAGYEGNSIILIRREYSLTANVLLNHYYDANAKMIFLGVGKNAGFNLAQYGFKAPDTTQSYGMISFVNIKFTGTNIFFTCDYLIRVFFENCSFDGGNHILYTTHYLQTWYFHNCVIRGTRGYVIDSRSNSSMVLDLQMIECLVERCNGFLIGYNIQGAFISNCCIEALSDLTVKVVRSVRNMVFDSNYFEQNNTGFYLPDYAVAGNGEMFDLTALTNDYVNHVVIVNNRFAQNANNEIISLGKVLLVNGYIIVKNNVSLSAGGKCVLVKTHNENTSIRTDVLLSGNANVLYSSADFLIDSSNASIAYTHELTDSDDLDQINQPGVYHAQANNAIQHAPVTDEFYLQVMRSNSGVAQLALTSAGPKCRLNTGDWA